MIFSSAKNALGAIIMNPSLLDSAGELLQDDLFAGEDLILWRALAQAREDGEEVTEASILQTVSSQGVDFAYLESTMTGLPRMGPEPFRREIVHLLQKRIAVELAKEALKTAAESKNGQPVNFAEIFDLVARAQDLETDHGQGKTALTCLGEIAPVPIQWLWQPFFPAGKISLIGGDPGAGKSWFCLDLAARVSGGFPWPDFKPNRVSGKIIFLAGEDTAADILRPRFDSLSGDPSKLFVFSKTELDLSSPEGIKILESEIVRLSDVRLLVIDPVLDFSGKTDPNSSQRVRPELMSPLARLAEKFNLTILLVMHLNKAQALSAIYRVGGSVSAWVGKSRAAFIIFRDRNDPKRRVFSPIKANLAPEDPAQLAFRLIAGRLEFENDPVKIDMAEHLGPEQRREDAPQLAEAAVFLRDLLKDGPVAAKEIQQEARAAGIALRTIERCKPELGITSSRRLGRWEWSLKL